MFLTMECHHGDGTIGIKPGLPDHPHKSSQEAEPSFTTSTIPVFSVVNVSRQAASDYLKNQMLPQSSVCSPAHSTVLGCAPFAA